MRPDERGGGPFAYYPATGALIRDAADDVAARAGDLGGLRRQLAGEHRAVIGAVDGELIEPLTGAAVGVLAGLDRVERVACFTAGVLRLFADAVDGYNHDSTQPRSVDALNAAYTDARLDSLGIDRDDLAGAAAYNRARDRAEAALVGPGGSLTAEYQRLGEQLDIWADHAARMLARGPNSDDVRELWLNGSLDSQAYTLWPGLHLDQILTARLPYDLRDGPDDTRALADLTNDELNALADLTNDELYALADDGNDLAHEIAGDRITDSYQEMTPHTELNLDLNPWYMVALVEGVPEDVARYMAQANPRYFYDILTPYRPIIRVMYSLAGGDLVEQLGSDPWSWKTLGEMAMTIGPGKVKKFDNAVDALDAMRDARHLDETAGWNDFSGLLREAAREKGTFGLGSGTREQANIAGYAWVGDNYRVSKDGSALISSDGLRQYRFPSHKKGLGIWQANFEKRPTPNGPWRDNGHLEILDPP